MTNDTPGAAGLDLEAVDLVFLRRDVHHCVRQERGSFIELGKICGLGKAVDVAKNCHHGFWIVVEELDFVGIVLLLRGQYGSMMLSMYIRLVPGTTPRAGLRNTPSRDKVQFREREPICPRARW